MISTLRIDTGISLPGEGALEVALDIVPSHSASDKVLFCLPGGAMNRRYWNLVAADGDDSFSFAAQMSRRGFHTVLVDHLGVGDSSRPQDGYSLTPEVITRANGRVVDELIRQLREGRGVPGLAPMPNLKAIGVGHSMGALLTVTQQFAFRQYAGIVVLGFATRGLEAYLPAAARGMDEPTRRANLVHLTRMLFNEPYPVLGRSADGSLYSGKTAEAAGVEAIKVARDVLLPVPAFMSMLPNNVAPEAAAINVPVFVGLGERDLTGPPEDVPGAFAASPAVELHVMPGAGHIHFLFPSRAGLFDALAHWAAQI